MPAMAPTPTFTYTYDVGVVNAGNPAAQRNDATVLDYVTPAVSNVTLYVSAACSSVNGASANWLGVQFNNLDPTPVPICTATAPGGTVAPRLLLLPANNTNTDNSVNTMLLFTALAKTAVLTPAQMAPNGNGMAPGTYIATVTVWSSRAKNTVPNVAAQQTFTVTLFVFDSTQAIQITPSAQNVSPGQIIPLTATVANSQAVGGTYAQFGGAPSLVEWSLVPFSPTENAGSPSTVCTIPGGGLAVQNNNGNSLATIGPSSTNTLTVANPTTGPITVYTCRPTVAPSFAANQNTVTLASQTYTVLGTLITTRVGDFRQAGTAGCAAGQPCFVLNKKGDDNSVGDAVVNFTGINGGIQATDLPVTGDWTGDGHTKVGIFRPSTNQWWLDTNNNGIFDAGDAAVFAYPGVGPLATDLPVTGDWKGLGKAGVGIFRSGLWVLDTNYDDVFEQPAAGTATSAGSDSVFFFGGIAGGGDVPVTGNWLGGAQSYVGYVRVAGGPGGPWLWVTDSGLPSAPLQSGHVERQGIAFGGITGDVPLSGDWFGTGTAGFGIVRSSGNASGAPFLWILDSASPTAVQAAHTSGAVFPYGGATGDKPVAGKW